MLCGFFFWPCARRRGIGAWFLGFSEVSRLECAWVCLVVQCFGILRGLLSVVLLCQPPHKVVVAMSDVNCSNPA